MCQAEFVPAFYCAQSCVRRLFCFFPLFSFFSFFSFVFSPVYVEYPEASQFLLPSFSFPVSSVCKTMGQCNDE